jgi:alpha-tubulin suppressor-like RCC1 family protein
MNGQDKKNSSGKKKLLPLLLAFLKNPKNIPLIASLVGGAGLITTGAILLAPQSNASSSLVSSEPSSSVPSSSVTPSSSSSVTTSSSVTPSSSSSVTTSSSSEGLPNFTVTFNAFDGEAVASQSIQQGQFATEPTSFYGLMDLTGWYTSTDSGQTLDTRWNFATNPITTNTTLYANWEVPLLTDHRRLANVDSFIIAIDDNQTLWAWGENNYGRLGIGSEEDRAYPTKVDTSFLNEEETMIHVTVSDYHSLLLTSENRVFGFGYARYWSLGIDPTINDTILSPLELTIPLLENETILNVWADRYTSWVLTSTGRLLVTGENNDGITGVSTPDSDVVMGFTEVPFPSFADEEVVVDFSKGNYSYFAISNLGNVFSWGYDWDSRLGLGFVDEDPVSIPSKVTFPGLLSNEFVTDISVLSRTVVAFTNQDRVFGIGETDDGELAPPEFDLDPYTTPQLIDLSFLDAGDKLVTVIAGNDHTVFYTESGKIYQVGDNGDGQLGTGDTEDTIVPIELDLSPLADDEQILEIVAGNDITLLRTNQNRWYGIGDNTSNLISSNAIEEISVLTEIVLVGLLDDERFIQLALGNNHSLGLTSLGQVYAWGLNVSGQLALDASLQSSVIPQKVQLTLNAEEYVTNIYASGNTSFALTSEGRLFGWGYNENSELGLGTTANQFSALLLNFPQLNAGETIDSFFLDQSNKYIITSAGRVLGWGTDAYYIGLGENLQPVLVPTVIPFTNLIGGEFIDTLFISNSVRAALTSTGRVFTWGYSFLGSLGLGLVDENVFTPTLVTFTGLNVGEFVTSIAFNSFSTLAITNNNRIFGWGNNGYNIFALADTNLHIAIGTPILLDIEGIVDSTIQMIYGSSNGTFYILTTNQELFSIGNNGNGQLGIGSTTDLYGTLSLVEGVDLNPGDGFAMMALDGYSAMVLTEEGRIFVWGVNDWGKLLNMSTRSSQLNSPLEVSF